jgi:hypothetical protein
MKQSGEELSRAKNGMPKFPRCTLPLNKMMEMLRGGRVAIDRTSLLLSTC